MPQVINTNMASLAAQKYLDRSQGSLQTSLQRLSSGLRVNSAKDDAAGLAIATSLSAQIDGLNQSRRNANDGISYAQVAEGSLDEMSNMLLRMRTLAVQSASGTFTNEDRAQMNAETSALALELERVVDNTSFNEVNPMKSAGLTVHVGSGSTTAADDGHNSISITFTNTAETIVTPIVDAGGAVITVTGADETEAVTNANLAVDLIDTALGGIATLRSELGAAQSRFSSVVNGLANTIENLSAARGRIVDADFAVETAALTRSSILQQAGVSVLAQANAIPNNVLALLQ